MTEQDLTRAIAMLQDDVDAAQKSLRNLMVVGGVIAVFVIGYMSFMYSNLKMITDESELAGAAVAYSEEQLGDALAAVQQSASEGAPEAIGALFDAAEVKLTELRIQLNEDIQSATIDFGGGVADWLSEYFSDLVDQNPQVALLALEDNKLDSKAMAHVKKDINEAITQQFEGGVGDELVQATKLLRDVRTTLEKIAANQSLSEDEKAQRRLILAFFRFTEADPGALREVKKELKDL